MNAILVTGQSNARNSGGHLQVLLLQQQIVNVAVGGSHITEWQKGTLNYNTALQANFYVERSIVSPPNALSVIHCIKA